MLLCYQRELPGYKHRNKDRLFDLVRSLRGWGGRAISKNKKKRDYLTLSLKFPGGNSSWFPRGVKR